MCSTSLPVSSHNIKSRITRSLADRDITRMAGATSVALCQSDSQKRSIQSIQTFSCKRVPGEDVHDRKIDGHLLRPFVRMMTEYDLSVHDLFTPNNIYFSGSGPLTVLAYCQTHPAPPCIHSRSGASIYLGPLKSLAGVCSSATNEGVSKPSGCTAGPKKQLHQVEFKAQLSICVCLCPFRGWYEAKP